MMNNHEEREAFEEVFPCSTGTVLNEYGHYESQVYQQDAMIQNISWVVWRAAKAQAVPEGFVLMPKEPTDEIIEAMNEFDYRNDYSDMDGAYRTIVEALEKSQEQK